MMPTAALPELKPNAYGFMLSGPVVLETVSALVDCFPTDLATVSIDLKQITRADSAALTLFLAWKRKAKEKEIRLHFTNWPDNLMSLVQLYSLESILATGSVMGARFSQSMNGEKNETA